MAFQIKDASGLVVKAPLYDRAYTASLLAFAPAITTNATLCQLVTMIGVAGTVARLKRVRACVSKTALGFVAIKLERWSTLGTLGSAVATAIPTQFRHGSPTAPGSAPSAPSLVVSSIGTAAYTTAGTVTGILDNRNVIAKVAAGGTVVDSAPDVWEVIWSDKGDQAPEICGAADSIVLSTTPVVGAGSVFDIEVQWEEATL
jgi:hypothetical protein